MLNNTPVLDIKPYIGDYDCPQHLDRDAESTCPDWIKRHGVQPKTIKDESNRVRFTDRSLRQLQQFHSAAGGQHSSEHLLNGRPVCNTYLNHKQTKRTSVEDDQNNEKSAGSSSHSLAEAQPDDDLCVRHMKCLYCLGFLNQWSEAARAIECILMEDPRSTYRRKSCNDRLYYFTVDTMHITCWFDPDDQTVEVLKVRPNYILL